MAGACAAGVVAVVVAGPDRGMDLSLPLTALGLALGLVGALLALAGDLPYVSADHDPLPGRARWLVRGGAVAVATLLAAALAVGVVPVWAAAANTEGSAARGGPQAGTSTLDGSVAWRDPDVPDLLDGQVVGTAGGIAVLADDGRVRMLDPASGMQRWSFRRWDASSRSMPGSVAVSADGRWMTVVYRVAAPRQRWVDDRRDRDRAWVFDTVSGRLRADVPVPREVRPLAVTADLVLVAADPVFSSGDGGWLTAVDHDGAVAWRHRPGDDCAPHQVSAAAGDLLALFQCGETQSLVRLDARTGRARWAWQTEEFGGDAASQGHALRRQDAVLAITGEIAVVDVRVVYQTRQGGTTGEVIGVDVWHNLVGVRLADGAEAWQRRDLHFGELTTSRLHVEEVTGMYATPGTVVIAEQNRSGEGRTRREAIALRAFTVAAGEPAWSADLPDSQFSVAVRNDSVAMLPDGRLVLAFVDFGAANGDDRCALAAWDTASGIRRADVRLFRTARDAVGNRCSESYPVEAGNGGVALAVSLRGVVMLR